MKLTEKIIQILDTFGMSGVKASEIMGITYNTFVKNKHEKETRHHFNQKHLVILINYIKYEADKLKI